MTVDLSGVPVFLGLPHEGVERLAALGRRRRYEAGETLLCQGDTGSSMHVILRGRVRIERSHPTLVMPITLVELEPGETVGGTGMFERQPSWVTATAMQATETLELEADLLADTLQRCHPVAGPLLRMLTKRVSATDEAIGTSADGGGPVAP